ncbi:protease SohB [Paraferrimonas haliotis]|uniref:Protease SohB n=1 Tax=Paraferrimonas haliotis TaxID=2013866 RepID=A0AA37WX30_9GAMM|nr:protease SohB [Paraferrimonas haliotis]GLS84153.1 protease SohB [Paraferrimonas haliotis]
MEFIYDLGLFSAKALVLVIAILAVVIGVFASASKGKAEKGQLSLTNISDNLQALKGELNEQLLSKKAYKAYEKTQKQQQKEAEKAAEKSPQSRLFVVDFKAGIDAAEVANLREEISAILSVAEKGDSVLVKVESGGGVVHGYGLAASQLDRVRQAEIELIVAIDKVAASGGYMMACVANKILSAPFAIVGSIGVVAQLPNFNKLLKKHDIDYEQHTAGDFKRTLTLFGENTDEGREKFQQEIEQTHELFKTFVSNYRPQLDIDKVATGEHWFGQQALTLNLVDELTTSDDYLLTQAQLQPVFKVEYKTKKTLADRIAGNASIAISQTLSQLVSRWQNKG